MSSNDYQKSNIEQCALEEETEFISAGVRVETTSIDHEEMAIYSNRSSLDRFKITFIIIGIFIFVFIMLKIITSILTNHFTIPTEFINKSTPVFNKDVTVIDITQQSIKLIVSCKNFCRCVAVKAGTDLNKTTFWFQGTSGYIDNLSGKNPQTTLTISGLSSLYKHDVYCAESYTLPEATINDIKASSELHKVLEGVHVYTSSPYSIKNIELKNQNYRIHLKTRIPRSNSIKCIFVLMKRNKRYRKSFLTNKDFWNAKTLRSKSIFVLQKTPQKDLKTINNEELVDVKLIKYGVRNGEYVYSCATSLIGLDFKGESPDNGTVLDIHERYNGTALVYVGRDYKNDKEEIMAHVKNQQSLGFFLYNF